MLLNADHSFPTKFIPPSELLNDDDEKNEAIAPHPPHLLLQASRAVRKIWKF